jgi:hypothetical protein
MAARPGSAVEKLPIERIDVILAGDGKARVLSLVAQDEALRAEAEAIDEVERLARYYRDLYRLLNNFVNFADFYAPDAQATFQVGRLYIDGREAALCVRVSDTGAHAALAALGKMYILYCDCTRAGGEKMTIAAAITNGDADNLTVGRNGVFYDRAGRDWDATITRIIENPISIRQAFWMPYKRLARMVEEQIEKVAAAREQAVTQDLQARVTAAAARVEAPRTKEKPAPFDVGRFAGIFAAIGLAIGAIGTAIAAVITGFLGLSLWQMPLAVGGVIMVISLPSMVIAWLKVRQRNLGPILDANGWALNGRVKVTLALGRELTALATLPKNARRSLVDPYQDRRSPWPFVLLVAGSLALLAYVLYDHGLLPGWPGRGR